MTYILSLDDFCEDEFQGLQFDRIDLLFRLKSRLPQLKVNLFTILGRSSLTWIREIQKISWIDMIPHGWHHAAGECAHWSEFDALQYLAIIAPLNLTKGFKAPGWRISQGTYTALLAQNYWVADLPGNNPRRPPTLRVYLTDVGPQKRVQGHIAKVRGDDGLAQRLDFYATLSDDTFSFIKDIL